MFNRFLVSVACEINAFGMGNIESRYFTAVRGEVWYRAPVDRVLATEYRGCSAVGWGLVVGFEIE